MNRYVVSMKSNVDFFCLQLLPNSLKRGGLFIVGQVVTGEFHDSAENALRCKDLWLEFLAALGVRAFSEVIVSPSVRTGVHSLVMVSA